MLHPEEEWRAYLAQGRFMLQRAAGSGRHIFYPRVAEPGTGDMTLDWVEATGAGTVHAVTVVRRKPPAPDYNVVLVDLAEGPRMMSQIVDIAPDAVHIGMAVRARIDQVDGQPLLVFVPA
jgi:uncharacterized OB-fold protein